MNTDRQIKALERKIAALKVRAHALDSRHKTKALSKVNAVAKRFGFASIHHLLKVADTAVVAVSTKRKRAKITAAIRAKVLKLLRSGETVKAVAGKAGISAPSVNVIKAKAGLTKARKSSKKTSAKGQLSPRKILGPRGVAAATKAKTKKAAPASRAEKIQSRRIPIRLRIRAVTASKSNGPAEAVAEPKTE